MKTYGEVRVQPDSTERHLLRAAARESGRVIRQEREAQEEADAARWWKLSGEMENLNRALGRRTKARPAGYGELDGAVCAEIRGHWIALHSGELRILTAQGSAPLQNVSALLMEPGSPPERLRPLRRLGPSESRLGGLWWSANVTLLVLAAALALTLPAHPFGLALMSAGGGSLLFMLLFMIRRLSQGRHLYLHFLTTPKNYKDSVPGTMIAGMSGAVIVFMAVLTETPLLAVTGSSLIGLGLLLGWWQLSLIHDAALRRFGARGWRAQP